MDSSNAVVLMRRYFPLWDAFENSQIAMKVANIWHDLWKNSKWENIEDAPFNVQCPGVSLINHTRSVTQGAFELAKVRNNVYGEKFDFDILLAGALLHDVSKLVEYEPGKGGAVKSKKGRLFQHGYIGAHKASCEGLPDEVVHIVICHTNHSRVLPQTPEAIVIYCADVADADLNRLRSGAPLIIGKLK